jgi:outer membrane protein OmpA-like peptidoglycan-associated protein
MKTFEVIGHTDAAGSPGYNLNLSQRRAASVKSYLVDQGVDPSRLRTLGRGASQLYNPRQPYSGENRRVEVAVGG